MCPLVHEINMAWSAHCVQPCVEVSAESRNDFSDKAVLAGCISLYQHGLTLRARLHMMGA